MDETTNNTIPPEETSGNNWAWTVTGIVVLAIAIGFYYWPAETAKEEMQESAAVPAEETADPATASLETVIQSDEVSDIESDLNATNLDLLDQELSEIESELNQ